MAQLDHYVSVGQKRLRCGYTTGTCAAAAARAAAELLLTGTVPPAVLVQTPAGIDVTVDVEEPQAGSGWASCAVRKDAGDDPDVTNGALVFARVSKVGAAADGAAGAERVWIDGGEGVGRVTREGLDQPVGAAAINTVPRQMIAQQVLAAADAAGYNGPLQVVVSIPAGVELARKTFNPRLGIEGGISVLGTSGIVKPMSEDALVASIQLELRMKRAAGVDDLVMTPGNYGADYALDVLGLDLDDAVQCSNYLGAALDYAVTQGFRSILLISHIGKLAKVAAGAMNTHSRVADGRREVLTAHAALAGAPAPVARALMDSVTTDAAIDVLKDAGLLEPTMASVMDAVAFNLQNRVGDDLRIESVMFSKVHGTLGMTPGAAELLRTHAASGATADAAPAPGVAAAAAPVSPTNRSEAPKGVNLVTPLGPKSAFSEERCEKQPKGVKKSTPLAQSAPVSPTSENGCAQKAPNGVPADTPLAQKSASEGSPVSENAEKRPNGVSSHTPIAQKCARTRLAPGVAASAGAAQATPAPAQPAQAAPATPATQTPAPARAAVPKKEDRQ